MFITTPGAGDMLGFFEHHPLDPRTDCDEEVDSGSIAQEIVRTSRSVTDVAAHAAYWRVAPQPDPDSHLKTYTFEDGSAVVVGESFFDVIA